MIILIIEDERKIAGFIKKGLEAEGYTVDVAYDGERGLALAMANDYDLIILDIMLPKLDGVTVCRELRAECQETPILMLTARDTVEDRVPGLDSGADDYLTKPFAFAELVARVRALLRRGGQGPVTAPGGRSRSRPGHPRGATGRTPYPAHRSGISTALLPDPGGEIAALHR